MSFAPYKSDQRTSSLITRYADNPTPPPFDEPEPVPGGWTPGNHTPLKDKAKKAMKRKKQANKKLRTKSSPAIVDSMPTQAPTPAPTPTRYSQLIILLMSCPPSDKSEKSKFEITSVKFPLLDDTSTVTRHTTIRDVIQSLEAQSSSSSRNLQFLARMNGTAVSADSIVAHHFPTNTLLLGVPSGMTSKEAAKHSAFMVASTKFGKIRRSFEEAFDDGPSPAQSGAGSEELELVSDSSAASPPFTPTPQSLAKPKSILKNPHPKPSAGGACNNQPVGEIVIGMLKFWGVFFLLVFGLFLVLYQVDVTTAMSPGSVLKSGGYKSECGMAHGYPLCSSRKLVVGAGGGVFLLDEAGEEIWKIKGKKNSDLVVGENGVVKIGSKKIRVRKELTPFPFDETLLKKKATPQLLLGGVLLAMSPLVRSGTRLVVRQSLVWGVGMFVRSMLGRELRFLKEGFVGLIALSKKAIN